ncbi:hypothetical protein Pelo_11447 [Pelomyxa schiedti]|nr:hypothetical protein Pelo_11447 [Pelomyxa schiedti]
MNGSEKPVPAGYSEASSVTGSPDTPAAAPAGAPASPAPPRRGVAGLVSKIFGLTGSTQDTALGFFPQLARRNSFLSRHWAIGAVVGYGGVLLTALLAPLFALVLPPILSILLSPILLLSLITPAVIGTILWLVTYFGVLLSCPIWIPIWYFRLLWLCWRFLTQRHKAN